MMPRSASRRLLATAAVVLCLSFPARAHNRSSADAWLLVSKEKAVLRLKTSAEDLWHFHKLKPDAFDKLLKPEIQRAMRLHRAFLVKHLRMRDAAGKSFDAKVTRVRDFSVPEAGIAVKNLAKYAMQFTLEYRFEKSPRNASISFELPENLPAPAEINLRIKTEQSPRASALLLPGRPVSIQFDWENNTKPRLTVGAGRVQSFVYVEARQIRHEILIPLATLEPLVALPRRDPSFLSIAEQQSLVKRIGDYFAESNPVAIAGEEREPIVERVAFFPLGTKDFARKVDPTPVSMLNGRVGIGLRYPVTKAPSQVVLDWTLFHEELDKIELRSSINRKSARILLEPENPTWRWNGKVEVRHPSIEPVTAREPQIERGWDYWLIIGATTLVVVTILLMHFFPALRLQLGIAAAALFAVVFVVRGVKEPSYVPIEPTPAREVADHLIRNTYHAFARGDESAIYDALEISADGELLRELYLLAKRGLTAQEEGGAVAEVLRVEMKQTRLISTGGNGFALAATWHLTARIEHWGHVHVRTNEYQARLSVQRRDAVWKLTNVTVGAITRLGDAD